MERGRNAVIAVACVLVIVAFLVGLGVLSAKLLIAFVETFNPG